MRLLMFLALCAMTAPVGARADAVTDWVAAVDRLDGGQMDRGTISTLFPAMHDALNAIQPRYARWAPPARDEPRAAGASPEAAIAGVAEAVLGQAGAALIANALATVPAGPARERGLALGRHIGAAAAAHSYIEPELAYRPFTPHREPWRWRPTAPRYERDRVPQAQPLLFGAAELAALIPPPAPFGSDTYRRDMAEVRRLGVARGSTRTADEEAAALFWAQQVSHRGFMDALVTLLRQRPQPEGLWASARMLALLSVVMEDSGLIIWQAKERYGVWRPISAIGEGGGGVAADPEWSPLVSTPPFPEYPSGHATDCGAAGVLLSRLLGERVGFTYRSLGTRQILERRYESFAAAARECSLSRIWAGVHYRETEDVSERIGAAIAEAALRRMTPLARGR